MKLANITKSVYRFFVPIFLMMTGFIIIGMGFGIMPFLAGNLTKAEVGADAGSAGLVGMLLFFIIWGIWFMVKGILILK